MAGQIPNDFIEEVRSKTDIVDIVSSYVQLSKSGKNLFGLCPFHEEKTPSFSVAEDKQIFHCFSCGRGGNVFSFIMEIENISFPESVIKVAELDGISLPQGVIQSNNPTNTKYAQFYKIYEEVSKFYSILLNNTEVGEDALTYLLKRGVSEENIKTFNLGFAPEKSSVLLTFLKEKNYSEDILKKSGLFSEDENGNLYDRFRNRIMFPIKDQNGNVVAFSGRILEKKDNASKYLNSPETVIFNKSKILFNFDLAKKEARTQKSIILFEGFMDVMSAYQAGIKNGVASMGTSLTDQQVYMINRIAKKVTICYDGDVAGQDATERAISLLDNKDFELGIVTLPEKLDPDEYIKKFGPDNFKRIVNNGIQTIISFRFNRLAKQYNLNNDHDKLEFLDKAINLLILVDSAVEVDLYLKKLSDYLSINLNAIQKQFAETKREHQVKQPSADFGQSGIERTSTQLTTKRLTSSSKMEIAEESLLYLTLRFKEVYNRIVSMSDFRFIHESYQKIFLKWTEIADFEMTISEFMDHLPSDLQQVISRLELKNLPDDYTDEEVDDYINVITSNSLNEEYKNTKQLLKIATASADEDRVVALTKKLVELKGKLSKY